MFFPNTHIGTYGIILRHILLYCIYYIICVYTITISTSLYYDCVYTKYYYYIVFFFFPSAESRTATRLYCSHTRFCQRRRRRDDNDRDGDGDVSTVFDIYILVHCGRKKPKHKKIKLYIYSNPLPYLPAAVFFIVTRGILLFFFIPVLFSCACACVCVCGYTKLMNKQKGIIKMYNE